MLGEKTFGAGLVLLGGMTTDNWHSPDPEAANLRANIIAYAADAVPSPPGGPTAIPALSSWALTLLAGLLGILALVGLRRRTC